MNHSTPEYAIVPTRILRANDISLAAKALYCEISILCCEKGYCDKGNKEIGDILGCSARSISRRIRELADRGCISVVIEGSREKDGNKKRIVRLR